MKRTPLRRKTPMRAKTSKRSQEPRSSKLTREPKRTRRGPERDEAYLAFIRRQPCLVPGCTRPAEAHHFGRGGTALKCSDYETVPLCHEHHVHQWHGSRDGIPGKTRAEWMVTFRETSEGLLARYRAGGEVF